MVKLTSKSDDAVEVSVSGTLRTGSASYERWRGIANWSRRPRQQGHRGSARPVTFRSSQFFPKLRIVGPWFGASLAASRRRRKRYRARYQSEGRWVTAPVTFTTKAAAKAWLANQADGHRSRRQGRPQPRQRAPRPLGPQLARNRSDLEETTGRTTKGSCGCTPARVRPLPGRTRAPAATPTGRSGTS